MARRYWLMKSEPAAYSWDDLVDEGEGTWDGVRNHRAANNLRAMKVGEQAFFYHSVTGKEIVGIAEITKAGIADPTDPEGLENLADAVTDGRRRGQGKVDNAESDAQLRGHFAPRW